VIKFKAAILTQINQPLSFDFVEAGEPSVGQALVRVLRSGICGAQLQEIAGNKGNAGFVPHLLGHEGFGLVESVGPGVKTIKRGDFVIMHWRLSDGIDSDFPRYRFKEKEMSSGKVTTFQQYSLVSENRLTPVRKKIDPNLGALLGCALSTSLACVENFVEIGNRVAVLGSGGVGGSLVMSLRMKWPKFIHAFDVNPGKRDWILSLGAHEFSKGLSEVNETYDVIFDTTGNPAVIGEATRKLAGSGILVLLGQPKPGETLEIPNGSELFGGEGKKIVATQGGGFKPSRDLLRFIDFCEDSDIPFNSLITSTVLIENVNIGVDLVKSGTAGRVVIDTAIVEG
jgi:Zn-dependent alcohol dehydrogenase